MFQIADKLATHGLGETTYPATRLAEGLLESTDFWIVDVRDMLDEPQDMQVYKDKIDYAISCLEKHRKIVICCGAGMSRSPAIAIGVLIKHYKMDFYDGYNLVHDNVPIAEIEPCHVSKLKKMFNVGLP
jgi:predicted protein tyrosine phosphatase